MDRMKKDYDVKAAFLKEDAAMKALKEEITGLEMEIKQAKIEQIEAYRKKNQFEAEI